MSIFEAIVLGVVQGLTEFLPISSSGHLLIVPAIMGWEDPGAPFTAVIQLGTMAAVLIYFRQDIFKITGAFTRSLFGRTREGEELEARMGWYLGLGTLPIIVFGVAFSDQIETGARNLYLTGSMLIIFGLVLAAADIFAKHTRKLESFKPSDAVVVGFAQSLALIPGVSRSGATITFGLFRGFTRRDAARFSFLLSIPAVVLSGAYEMKDAIGHSTGASTPALIASTLAAFVVGYWSIAFLLKWLGEHTMKIFVYYRLVLGTLVLILAATGAITSGTVS
ncbi:MAG: undecaprenyl-diphosphate phosphatase [Thermoleophilaceae bacterium]|nr:undecaprenyl-diphosphate phosphatase [Thermoleophilaceae bacterium]